jgi:hypothetical protein
MTDKWRCPQCRAGFLEHPRGGKCPCEGIVCNGHKHRIACGAAYDRSAPCNNTQCMHCGWRGAAIQQEPIGPDDRRWVAAALCLARFTR